MGLFLPRDSYLIILSLMQRLCLIASCISQQKQNRRLDRNISRHGGNLLAQTGLYHIDTVKIEALHIAAGQRKRQLNPVRCLPAFPVQVLSMTGPAPGN